MFKHTAVFLFVIGCATEPDDLHYEEGILGDVVTEDNPDGTIAAAACYTAGDYLDGYPLFSPHCNAGTTDFWTGDGKTGSAAKLHASWVRTGWQWQCVEFAARYFHFARGVSESIWDGVVSAKYMCETASAHPSYVQRLGNTTTVKAGDMVVYDGAGHGHVAIVGAVNASNTSVLTFNQNTWADYVGGTPLYRWWRPKSAAKCYVRPAIQQPATCGPTPFTDICASPFKPNIEWLYASGITTGCSASKFCPTASLTRGELASFFTRAYGYPGTTINYFSDDNGSPHEGSINSLAKAGITTGCAPGLYCPSGIVSRGQMAAFLVRAEKLTAGATINYFSDDNGHQFEQALNMARHAGIYYGCGGGKACPEDNVTREQLAAFLNRAQP